MEITRIIVILKGNEQLVISEEDRERVLYQLCYGQNGVHPNDIDERYETCLQYFGIHFGYNSVCVISNCLVGDH